MKTLLSFLGRAPSNGRYETVAYAFPGEAPKEADTTKLLANALRARIQPQRYVLLGTAGSMWDCLLEDDPALEHALLSEHADVLDAVREKSVTQEQLDRAAGTLTHHMGCEVLLRLTPYGLTEDEQLQLAGTLADVVRDGDTLHLDVTHGFRHLPLLACLSVLFLQALQPRLKLERIWYGSVDFDAPTIGGKRCGQVYSLEGLVSLARWAEAVHRNDQDGNLGAFAELLPAVVGDQLRRAAFFERTHQPKKANKTLDEIRSFLKRAPLHGLGKLFEPALLERLPAPQEAGIYPRQRRLALENLRRRDYLRAAVYGVEARITRLMDTAGISAMHADIGKDRDEFMRRYWEEKGRPGSGSKDVDYADHRKLNDLRNRLAHGFVTNQNDDMDALLSDENRLGLKLEELLAALLPAA